MRCLAAVAVGLAVGGLVGYLTNEVAVWLLFHPVRPVCLLGRRFCLWGVVPRRSRELAARMGRLVEQYMLSGRVWARVEEEMRRVLLEEAERLLGRSMIGSVLGLGELARRLAEEMAGAAARAAAGLVRRVDVARVVEEELAAMDPASMERMFREIAGRELRIVVVSGLVLGAAIGLLQGLLLCLLGG